MAFLLIVSFFMVMDFFIINVVMFIAIINRLIGAPGIQKHCKDDYGSFHDLLIIR